MLNILYSAVNSTVYDYCANYEALVAVMKRAQRKAEKNSIHLHVVSALPLTGPAAQAYNSFIHSDNIQPLTMIKQLACDSLLEHSNLITLISFPWYDRKYAHDKINNRPFYATAVIYKGKITKIHLESYFEYEEGGPYNARYFAKWPMGLQDVVHLDGDTIAVGSFTINGFAIASNLTQACQFIRAYPDVHTIILNTTACYHPNDMKALSQLQNFQRYTLLFGNPLGTDSGDKVGSGAVFVYKNGALIYCTPQDKHYGFFNSVTYLIADSAPNLSTQPTRLWKLQSDAAMQWDGYYNIVKAHALWLRDYLLKTKQQGFVIAMSDSANAVYSLFVANLSIDLAIQANGMLAYLSPNQMGHLTGKNEILACFKEQGFKQAHRLLKKQMLTCVYASDSVLQQQRSIVETMGASVHLLDINGILDANFAALPLDLLNELDSTALTAAFERAYVMQTSIISNLENKIGLSNACATEVALGHLHAGGLGQEGPISVTLSLFQTQILAILNLYDRKRNELIKQEYIIEYLIQFKMAPIATFRYLKTHAFYHWNNKTHALLQDIDDICRIWSMTQPSRVALSIAPQLGSYGCNLDRYRGVRNTRDNHYFHNGRVELKLEYLKINEPNTIMIACADTALKQYLLDTPYEQLNREKCLDLITAYMKRNHMIVRTSQTKSFHVHAATASLHQTMFDYSRNSQHIKQAIQQAEDAGAAILLLPELCLTGYFGDGDFAWINTQEEGDKILKQALNIAQYAKESALIISIGFPVFIQTYPKPFVGQALLQHGNIIAISLKTIQPEGAAEYEAMHFTPFDIQTMGVTFDIKITGQQGLIPVGKPIVVLNDRHGNLVSIYHEQCAEGWVGVRDDGTINDDIQQTQRYLNTIAPNYPGLIVLNPSGSKCDVRYDKATIRRNALGLAALNQNPMISAYLYANVAGDDNGTVVADGDHFILSRQLDGSLSMHQGLRYELGKSTLNLGAILIFKKPSSRTLPPLPYDNSNIRRYTEISFASSIWILNTLRHHKKQCFIISLSGGADSSFGVIQILNAIDLFIQQQPTKQMGLVALFDDYFAHLHCKSLILECMNQQDVDAAIQLLKQQILVCVYMPTDNSSKDTLLSARTLMKAGRLLVCSLQQALEASILSYAGTCESFGRDIYSETITSALSRQVHDWPEYLSSITDNKCLFKRIIVLFSEKKIYDKQQLPEHVFPTDLLCLLRNSPLTWWNPSHDLAKQNLQARLRSIIPWLLAQIYDGLPLYTSNLSEGAAGYSTWAGDTSLGYENSLGGIFKSDVKAMLIMYEQGKLCGLKPIPGLCRVNHLEPSAELRPLNEKGLCVQTDEADLMPYQLLDTIIATMILEHNTPWQTYQLLKNNEAFKSHKELVSCIKKVCHLYQSSQFKRTGGGNTPFFGSNLDPHVSEATPLISKFLANGVGEL